MLKLSSAAVYWVQRCSTSSFTPPSLVSEHFEPPQNRMQESALSFEHPRHVGAQRLRAGEDQPAKKIAICRTPMLVMAVSSESSPDGAARRSGK